MNKCTKISINIADIDRGKIYGRQISRETDG